MTGLISENEEILWAESGTTQAEPLKTELNREVGKILEARTRKKADLAKPDIAVLLDLEKDKVELHVNSLYIYGRYRKLVRGIPQTRWPCRECKGAGCAYCDYTGKMYKESIDELIKGPVLEATLGTDTAFHGAGREDIDALMLGEGRPFIVEAKSPRLRFLDLANLEKAINNFARGKIEVSGLTFVEGGMVERLKAVRLDKVYRIKVLFDGEVSEERLKSSLNILGGATIKQRTPTRVLHRRADLERVRRLHFLEIEELGGNKATLIVGTEGGLYVKELITGDGGRTRPSLSEVLGIETKVVELDVIKVILEESVCRSPMVSGESRATN
jgi:tRNA pseudouridine synthase 10